VSVKEECGLPAITEHVRRFSLKPIVSSALILLLAGVPPVGAAPQQQENAPAKLNIAIIEGEDAINNIRLRTAREPIVEVTDENHKPIAGALVLFTLPNGGAGGAFANGARTFSILTDSQGRAIATGLKPNAITGKFQIRVDASYRGASANTTIAQKNARPGLSTMTKVLIASAVVAGIVIGIVVARSGGKGTTPTVITPGPPTVGGR
jgi:hypothetical protein